MAAHIAEDPVPVAERRADLSQPLAAAVMRCLAKDREDRWQSATDLLSALDTVATPGSGVASVSRPGWRSPKGIAAGLAVGAVILALGFWGLKAGRQASDLRWAREEALPEIERLLEVDEQFEAWLLARRVEERVSGDPVLDALWPRIARASDISSDPADATVRIARFDSDTAEWVYLGKTPLQEIRLPWTYMRVRIERDGYAPFDGGSLPWRFPDVYRLTAIDDADDRMARIPGAETELQLSGLEHLQPVAIDDYRLDRYEVTNREFKTFVDSGGYRRPEFWKHAFELDGRTMSFEQAMARFVDATGRPGPSTWEGGDYPSGEGDFPVAGVSWYEAAAFAAFVGKELPTIYHWARAADTWASAWIVPRSNLLGSGPAAVGQFGGMGPYGTMDMAGNVREWCLNAGGDERYILGGGWNDPSYAFNDAFAQPPFDRSIANGLRLASYAPGEDLSEASRPIMRLARNFMAETPVSDEVFAAYRRFFDYDPTPLEAAVEVVDTTDDFIRERIAYNTAYGERMLGYLVRPRHGTPPFQTVIYFPGSGSIFRRNSEGMFPNARTDFIVKSGRAVMHPVYKSTYERGDSLRSDYADESAFYKEHVIAWVKDYRRSVDYIATRGEIDTTALAYFGFSWGGYLGGLIPALEPRLSASVLYVAGLEVQRGQPEVEPLNYLPRITIPVLMLNGEYDHFFPKETSQQPMFELLGTPEEHKRWVVFEGGHFVPRAQLISETLDWLDRYLGEVR
jgi:dienelactone hydrolase